jgi:hypothetical protein
MRRGKRRMRRKKRKKRKKRSRRRKHEVENSLTDPNLWSTKRNFPSMA